VGFLFAWKARWRVLVAVGAIHVRGHYVTCGSEEELPDFKGL
jgi:hypothetical protein